MPHGYLAILLHAHLPFVRHPEHEQFLEEDWLYEAMTETYIPLLDVFEGLLNDGVDFKITMSLTPTLCSMLRDSLLQERYVRHLHFLIELSGKEIERTRNDHAFHNLAWFYNNRLTRIRNIFCDRYGRDLTGAFRKFQDLGRLEIITCAATHAFLPLMMDYPQAVRAQILTARDHYRECFGCDPRGIWLPECAYTPGIEEFLQEANIRWFTLDTHGLLFGKPRPRCGIYNPVFTPTGPAVFARDFESSKQVWSAEAGYPGDFYYREFYRDVGFDLDYDYIRPHINSDGTRKFTGIKYYRITGKNNYKEPYLPEVARGRAAEHAGNFMFNRERQAEHLHKVMGIEPIILAPYDAELFGHWWFEGPDFLDFLFRKIAFDQNTIGTTTPGDYLAQNDCLQIVEPAASSWGNKGSWDVWLEGSNAWIYKHLHVAAGRMTEIARQFPEAYGLYERVLRQCARELMLAQSSDWAFIMKTGTTVNYAVRRTKEHLLRFNRLYEQIKRGQIDEAFLGHCEWKNNIFPGINWRYYM